MNAKISFGECLKQLLLIREWSASRLAREINIEPSYVRMWVRGERVPSLQSDYVKLIKSTLVSGLDSTHKKAARDSFLQYIYHLGLMNAEENRSLSELIEAVLKEAQIYSLSRKKKRAYKYRKVKNTGQIAAGAPDRGPEPADGGFPVKAACIPSCIEERYSILNAVLSVLQSSIHQQDNGPGELMVTYQSYPAIFEGYPALYEIWESLITKALKKKWEVRYLYRVSKNPDRSRKLIQEIINWSGYKNRFLPFFFTNYKMTSPPLEMMTVHKAGAFIFMAANNAENIDRALYFKQNDSAGALHAYMKRTQLETKPMLRYFPTFSKYIEFLSIMCRKRGDFYAVSQDLYFCTVPVSLWEKYIGATDDPIAREIQLKRLFELCRVFHEDVKKFRAKHICQLEVLEMMVESQSYLLQYFCQTPTSENILEHLEYVVHLLKKYTNFEIALVSENQDNIILPAAAWEVRGGRNAGIVTVDMENHADFAYLSIAEETVTEAFGDYFLEIWEKITPKHRDKQYVISWFEEKIRYLREKLDLPIEPDCL